MFSHPLQPAQRDRAPARVCLVNAYFDARLADPTATVERLHTPRELGRALAAAGAAVDVVYASTRRATIEREGVRHWFVPTSRPLRWAAAGLGAASGRPPARFQPAFGLFRLVEHLRPDVIHFFGLTLHLNLALAAHTARRLGVPLFVHYHGGKPPARPLVRALQRYALRDAASVLFTTADQAEHWVVAGLLSPSQVRLILETSAEFTPQPQASARAKTGMAGDPVLLWAGRLHPIKDPLVGLRAFEHIVAARPAASLYLYYLTAELLPDLQAFVRARPHLAGRVHFRGCAPRETLPAIYSSADFLVQASRREFSGLAVLEAMACGAIPAVTRIPSFRMMTEEGRFGVLFEPGDWRGLAEGVLAVPPAAVPAWRRAVHEKFVRDLSFPAIAGQLLEAYRAAMVARR